MDDHRWLRWAQQLQAVAQTGAHFAVNDFDRQRYGVVRQVAAEMLAAGSGADPRVIEGLFAAEHGYATPRLDVRAAVFRDDRVLLVKERADGLWTLPGGYADVGDSPSEAVEREVREESGFEVRAVKLAALFDRNSQGHPPFPWHQWKVFFLCEILSGTATPSVETEAVDFFDLAALPPLSPGRTTARQLRLMFEHHRDRSRPTSFD